LGQLDTLHLGLDYQESRDVEMTLKRHLLPPRLQLEGASYGIRNKEVPNEAREAFDIHDVIRHQLWLDQPEDKRQKYTVDSDTPYARGYSDTEIPVIIRPENLVKLHVAKRFLTWLRQTLSDCVWNIFPRKAKSEVEAELYRDTDDICYAAAGILSTLEVEEAVG